MNQTSAKHGAAAVLAALLLGGATTAPPALSQVLGPPPAPSDRSATAGGPPLFPSEDVPAVLHRLELTAVGQASQRKKGTEIAARTKDGRPVVVKFDRFGRLKEVEAERSERSGFATPAFASPGEVEAGVRRAGFEPRGIMEFKKNHVTVFAQTRDQQPVELHVDRAGTIYKQKWLR